MLPAWSVQCLGWGMLTVALALPSLAWVLGWVRPPDVAPLEQAPVVTPEPAPVVPAPVVPTPDPPPTDTGCTPGLDDPPTGGPVGAGRTALAGTTAPLTLVALSGGAFTMGSADGEGDDDEHPRHRVCLAGFEISTHEVTNAQWKLVMDRPWPSVCPSGCTEAMPVTDVSWQDAVRFANALSARERLRPCYTQQAITVTWDPTCDGYRLPTEAEWEYATRAGTTGPYSFDGGEAELGKYAWFGFNVRQAQAVGLRAANPWGLFDVHGNVWEWVWDKYGEYSVGMVMPSNPAGPDVNGLATVADSPVNSRVLRGGSFILTAVLLRSANRVRNRPTYGNWSYGFRVTRGPRPQH